MNICGIRMTLTLAYIWNTLQCPTLVATKILVHWLSKESVSIMLMCACEVRVNYVYCHHGYTVHLHSNLWITVISLSCGSQVVKFLENSNTVNPFDSSLLMRNQSWLWVSMGGSDRVTAYLSYYNNHSIKKPVAKCVDFIFGLILQGLLYLWAISNSFNGWKWQ